MNHEDFMREALAMAQKAYELAEVPIGAVLVCDNKIIAKAYNQRELLCSPLGHAELLVIEEASIKLSRWRLNECSIYSTIEPCLMCAGAIIHARIKNLYFGASDPKIGAASLYDCFLDQRLNHKVAVQAGLMAEEARFIMQNFFKERRLAAKAL